MGSKRKLRNMFQSKCIFEHLAGYFQLYDSQSDKKLFMKIMIKITPPINKNVDNDIFH